MNTFFRRTAIVLVALTAVTMSNNDLFAQQVNFELAQRFTRQSMAQLIGSNGIFPRWMENTNNFWYTYKALDGQHWYYVNTEEAVKKEIFDRQWMASKLSMIFNKPFNYQNLELRAFRYDENKGLFTFNIEGTSFTYDMNSRELIKKGPVERKQRTFWKSYSPDSTWIVFARDHNLFLMKTDDPNGTEYQLTTEGERWYSFQANAGVTDSDRRMRARVGWFEDSNKFYVRRRDVRKVNELWLVHNLSDPRPTLETYKYALPGEEHIGKTEFWVFKADTISGTDGVKLETDKEEWAGEGFRGIYTGSGSDYLWIIRRNRARNNYEVLKANTTTGEVEVLWNEVSKPYMNPRFISLSVINGGEQYIWWSERTGWGQLYRYDSEGNLINRITEGYYQTGNIVKIDTAAQTIYFQGYGREEGVNPYYAMLYKIKFDGSNVQRLTPEDATHQTFMAEESSYFVDNYSRVDLPTKTVLRNGDGEVLLELEEIDLSRLKEIGWKAPSTFTVKAADGVTDLYGVMWKPFDFDSTKTYPIIVWCYPGPQTVPFPSNFQLSSANADHVSNTALAQLGFIVVAVGNRGASPLRSRFVHTYGYGNLRDYPLADNKYALEQLAARNSFIDISRVGIYGHSGGGFMSTAAILTYPGFYDVAVSASGNHDNNVYNLSWSESHNGVKKIIKTVDADTSMAGMQDSTVVTFEAPVESNAELAENLEGHLLLVTGGVDNNVHPANTIRVVNALMKAGKHFDFMIMPGQRHHFGEYKPYYTRMVWRYFAKYLLGYHPDDVDFNIPNY